MFRSFTYDAENRQASATIGDPNSVSPTSYVYDGYGRRVTKRLAGGQSTTYVYDAFGNLAAEYGGTASACTGTCYVTVDHLGSTRMLTDSTGAVVRRYDYLPFGGELAAAGGLCLGRLQ